MLCSCPEVMAVVPEGALIMFSLSFLPEPSAWHEIGGGPVLCRSALLRFGELERRLAVPLGVWHEEDYELQRREGIGRIVLGAAASCLVVSAPELAWFGLRPLDGRCVAMQDRSVGVPGDLDDLYVRAGATSAGAPVATVARAELAAWLERAL